MLFECYLRYNKWDRYLFSGEGDFITVAVVESFHECYIIYIRCMYVCVSDRICLTNIIITHNI